MSFLSLAYLAGAIAVGLPILAHLIRQTPRDEQVFSSLMFLEASPPRFTRRSKIDQWLLLLLRAAALVLLAFAFARPFLRGSDALAIEQVRGRQVAVLVDVSASMQRDGVMERAKETARELVNGLADGDVVSLYEYDERLRPVAGAAIDQDDEGLSDGAKSAGLHKAEVVAAIAEMSPTHAGSQAGKALVAVVEEMTAAGEETDPAVVQVELVSDFVGDLRLDAAVASRWPDSVRVRTHRVSAETATDATVNFVASAKPDSEDIDQRAVRVTNGVGSDVAQFALQWYRGDRPLGDPTVAIVPAGESRVVDIDREPVGADRLALKGDREPLGNTLFFAPTQQLKRTVHYFGDERADDAEAMRFYLEQALVDTAERTIRVVPFGAAETDDGDAEPRAVEVDGSGVARPDLLVMTGMPSAGSVSRVSNEVREGSLVLCVVESHDAAVRMGALVGPAKAATGPSAEDHLRLAYVDFQDLIWQPFDAPQFNDFTDLRFWQPCRLELNEAGDEAAQQHVIASYEDGSPFLWRRSLGRGTVLVMTCGWQPDASQLALSNRFVPLLEQILAEASPFVGTVGSISVGEPIAVERRGGEPIRVTAPAGDAEILAESDTTFRDTIEPGVYVVSQAGQDRGVAVNHATAEVRPSVTEPEQLASFGIPLGVHESRREAFDRRRNLRDREIEDQQKLWKLLIVAALVCLLAEMGLAGYLNRSGPIFAGRDSVDSRAPAPKRARDLEQA